MPASPSSKRSPQKSARRRYNDKGSAKKELKGHKKVYKNSSQARLRALSNYDQVYEREKTKDLYYGETEKLKDKIHYLDVQNKN